jgi:hypothetical protein
MDTHEKLIAKMLEDPDVRAEYDCIEREEMPMFDMILSVRRETGLSQAQARRVGNAFLPTRNKCGGT